MTPVIALLVEVKTKPKSWAAATEMKGSAKRELSIRFWCYQLSDLQLDLLDANSSFLRYLEQLKNSFRGEYYIFSMPAKGFLVY